MSYTGQTRREHRSENFSLKTLSSDTHFLQRCQLGDFADCSGHFPEPPWRFQKRLATNLESRSDLSEKLDADTDTFKQRRRRGRRTRRSWALSRFAADLQAAKSLTFIESGISKYI